MSELKKVYVADGPGDAHVLRGLLEVAGIAAVVRGDDMVPLQGGSLFNLETRPSVWILASDDQREQHAQAVQIVEDYAAGRGMETTSNGEQWACKNCDEMVEAHFTVCWNCGVSRE
jgi:hypothetical protein